MPDVNIPPISPHVRQPHHTKTNRNHIGVNPDTRLRFVFNFGVFWQKKRLSDMFHKHINRYPDFIKSRVSLIYQTAAIADIYIGK